MIIKRIKTNFQDNRGIITDIIVKGISTVKHIQEIYSIRYIPVTDILIKTDGILEGIMKGSHILYIPILYISIKTGCV